VFKYNFPVRNRVIASMSHAVAVIQATTKSGSLITAREALDCGRDVFAVPGSIFQETSDGTNDLIAKGAHVLRSAADLTSHYPELSTPQNSTAKFAAPVGEVQQKILAATSVEGSRAEDLAASLKLPIQVVAAALTMLEMAGCIATNSSGIYAPVLSPHLTRQNQSN
jgi:DNA processing protein